MSSNKNKNKVILTDAVPDIDKYWDYDANEGKNHLNLGLLQAKKSGQNVRYVALQSREIYVFRGQKTRMVLDM